MSSPSHVIKTPTTTKSPTVTNSNSIAEIITSIEKQVASIHRVFTLGASVTRTHKTSIKDSADKIKAAAKLLRSKFNDGPNVTTVINKPVNNVSNVDTGNVTVEAVTKLIKEGISQAIIELKPTVSTSSPTSMPNPPSVPTYADKVKTPLSRPAIIIESTDVNAKSSKDVLDVWRKDVSFKTSTFAPAKIQPLANGKLRVEFNSQSECDSTLRKIDGATSIKGETAKRRLPLIILKGVSTDVESEELTSVILQQNPTVKDAVDGGKLSLKFLRSNRRDGLYNAVLEVDQRVRLSLLSLQRVNVDHQRVRALDYSPFVQCFKCLQFGHTQKKCTSDSAICSYCGDVGHDVKSCGVKENVDKLMCYNCHNSNEKYSKDVSTSHSATSPSCQRIKFVKSQLIQRTNFEL